MTTWKRVVALILVAPVLLMSSQTIQERAVGIPIGNTVYVKMADKTKWQGQLVSVSQTGVTVRVAEPGAGVQEKLLPFDQIKSISGKKDSNTAWKVLAGVGIALGTLLVIGIITAVSDS